MARGAVVNKSCVPFLHERVIDEHARWLLDEWAESHPPVTEPPVPIEEILEIGLGLDFEICDLQTELGHPDVLGAIWFGDRLVKMDQSLDPSITPKMLGRYRYTLAHEAGHWRLHRQHLMDDPAAVSLFEERCEPAFVCRSSAKPREEWQADRFAACMLMPRQFVFDAWMIWRGSDEPVAVTELSIDGYHDDRQANEEMAMERFCRPLADQFEVSAQAMRIRLQVLELLVKEKEPRLF